MKRFLVCLTLLVSGCNATMPWQPAPGKEIQVHVDEETLKPCPPLPTDVVIRSGEDILAAQANTAKLYAACATRQSELAGLVRKHILSPSASASAPQASASAPEKSQ